MKQPEVLDFLDKGQRLQLGDGECSSDTIRTMMSNCWKIDPHERPSFHSMLQEFVVVEAQLLRSPDTAITDEDFKRNQSSLHSSLPNGTSKPSIPLLTVSGPDNGIEGERNQDDNSLVLSNEDSYD
jgi:hypothetical protein